MPFAANTSCLNGRYTLLGKLGAGGQAEVWCARDHQLGEKIALKVLDADVAQSSAAWEALQREHAIVSRLDHPLILKLFPPTRDERTVALPMELAAGGDLRRLVGMSYLEIGPVLLEVAEALAHAHAVGVVHRDLKPENILFDARGHVRLADFGVAGTVATPTSAESASGCDPDPTPRQSAGRTGLSPFTASPEQLRNEPPAISDDIYGLGALAYELLSGHPPYYPRFELKRAIEEPVERLRPTHQAPERLIALVMAMLAKSPQQRPASMREVIDALDSALNDTLIFEERGVERPPLAANVTIPQALRNELPAGTHSVPPSARGRELASDPHREQSPATEDLRALWAEIKEELMPNLLRPEPERRSRWPWVLVLSLAVGVAAAGYLWLPRDASGISSFAQVHWRSTLEMVNAMKRIADASQRIVSSFARPAPPADAGSEQGTGATTPSGRGAATTDLVNGGDAAPGSVASPDERPFPVTHSRGSATHDAGVASMNER